MNAQDLKNSILQLAVQGKLVPQDQSDEPASELLKRIRKEKERLVAEGKIRKEKPLPTIGEEEIPFDIPDTWQWVRLGDVFLVNPRNFLDDKTEVSFIPMSSIDAGFVDNHTSETSVWGKVKKNFTHLKEGDIVCAKITPCFQNRKSAILKNLKNGYGAGTTELHVLRTFSRFISVRYVLWFLKNNQFIIDGMRNFTGTAGQQRVSTDYFKHYLFPLPPLAEQARIVSKIEELLPKITEYGKAQDRLTELNAEVPDQLRKSILMQAVQGKLTDRDPSDEPASALLERIRAEKARLMAEGKIRKEKPLPPIGEDEIPFDIPDTWQWVRLGNIVTVNGGKRIPAGRTLSDLPTPYKYIRVTDMKNNTVCLDKIKYVPEDIFPHIQQYIIHKEDVYITVAGTIGAVGGIPEELDGANLTENADKLVFHHLNKKWLIQVLSSPCLQEQIIEATNKMSQPKLAIQRIQQLLIPLPPLAEQARIVERVETLLAKCSDLK